ncbi:RNA methyltransferase, TrmH family [Spiroplasma sabaudiense Ar-1343]|uniref:RNA methyltransferase, TrmH family n=1 Tax=Spiroplasma sabaudiense Ar-1343 TaxID=1276257 RepID=W6AA14_9MOLU|nr:RNA methyltransferase [Spiroplasma sabaudiense]AHI54023.1 RNA methyltransferase, TrmH family [Spiroplasma sabaudiense Ar-1343]
MTKATKITAISNQLIQDLLLLRQAKFQKEKGLFLIEGENLIKEAIINQQLVKLLTNGTSPDWVPDFVEKFEVTPEIIKKLSDTKSPQNFIGVVAIKEKEFDWTHNILVLEDIQDPGNMGSLIRSAKAFGYSTIVASPSCVSFFNPKVIRSTQGYIFSTNLKTMNLVDFLTIARSKKYQIIGTNIHEKSSPLESITSNNKKVLLLGNEGKGLSSIISKFISTNFVIEMNEQVESLNVSVAGAIIMNLTFN